MENGYVGPVEGIHVLVDMQKLMVIEFEYQNLTPDPLRNWNFWNFWVGFTPREGLVIHFVAYDDGSRGQRSVFQRLSFVEMVVPYGDPNEPHYRKNVFDAREDGFSKNVHSLKKVVFQKSI